MLKNMIAMLVIIAALVAVILNFAENKQQGEVTKQESVVVTENPMSEEVATKQENANVQYVAPDFELSTLDGKTVMLSDYWGKKIILNFWATWCPPCKAEMPHMQKIYDKYKDQGVEILAVNLTSQDTKSKIAPFVQEFGLTFPILLDEEGYVGQKYQIMTVPTSLMIDTKGNIVETIAGPMDEALMESLIEKAQ